MSLFCFDLDGTIFNSIEGITVSLNFALKKNNLKTISEKNLSQFIGPPLLSYIDKITKEELSLNIKNKIIEDFRAHHDLIGFKFYNLYPDVYKILKQIREENKLFVVTNKPYKVTENSLKHFKLFNFFDDIYTSNKSTDNLKKWSKGLVRNKSNYLLELDKLHPNFDKYYIGDTESDFKSTFENSFEFIYASYGYGKKFNNEKIKYKLQRFNDICKINFIL